MSQDADMNVYEQLLISLKKVHRSSVDVMKQNAQELSPGQLFLLFMIYEHGKMKMTDIAHYFGITPGAATGIADKLEKQALIERGRDANDRRMVVISLSDKGLAYVLNQKKAHVKVFESIFGQFSEEELAATVHSLNKIYHALDQYQAEHSSD
ncbi:MarR family winged helix-turn-helix transcriptional regulator [Caldalkalibacillus salinus]|uniref:MarR family winged helix-turn-helix transcriptional regulator n=1 Tax=Caldalkalibacillus salinus TaxID=2803787 RepID=UPI0019209471|nr:MarR family transcriptional regulator [Caldalkalibacillus salinus]